jgi:iron complex transport system ATP-binding protein
VNEGQAVCAIGAEGVSLRFGARYVVEGLSLETRSGELVGVIGPNGAGKSSFLRLLACLLPPDTGVILIEGHDVARCPPGDVARRVASVPQNTTIDFAFAAREIVLMGRHPHLGRFAVESERDLQIVEHAMAQTGTVAFAERSIATLSGGERQLVLIAKALAQQPHVLLLDEPVASLDIRHQLDVLNLVRRQVVEGVATIVVLHDLNLAARFCDRLILMAHGRILAMGTPSEVLTEATLRAAYRVHARIGIDPATGSTSVTAVSTVEV